MSGAAQSRPPAQRPLGSRTQLVLNLYKGGAQSDTIKQDAAAADLDRVSLRQRADEQEQLDCEEPWPCPTCPVLRHRAAQPHPINSQGKILVFVPRVAGILDRVALHLLYWRSRNSTAKVQTALFFFFFFATPLFNISWKVDVKKKKGEPSPWKHRRAACRPFLWS